MDKQVLKNERVTLVNLEYGHVTVIIPKKLGHRYIYGTIVWKEQDETQTRDDKWDMTKYKVLPGAQWDLLDLEHKYTGDRNEYRELERHAEYEAENKARELRDNLFAEWRKTHPEPENPLTAENIDATLQIQDTLKDRS